MPDTDPGAARSIRSYVLRRSHFSPAQRDAYERLMTRFGIPWQPGPIDLDAAFGRKAPKVLEIGFGMGETTAAIAAQAPEVDFLGIDVHTPGVGALLKRVEQTGLTNVRVIEFDAHAVVDTMIGAESLDGIHVFFPDPWPKARHHKRRLLQEHFVTELARRLKKGGYLHVATDWTNYAEQVIAIVDGSPGWVPQGAMGMPLSTPQFPSSTGTWKPGLRPSTKFERRGLALGHSIVDIVRFWQP